MFTRILLAVDDSASCETAVGFAIALAKQESAAVRVVHVNEYLVGGRGHTVKTQSEAIAHLEEVVESLRAAGIPTVGTLYLTNCFGVDARIATAAHDWSADVIVLGSRRQRRFGPFSRFAGQGIRERVMGLTSLPVLVAPAPLAITTDKLPELHDLPTAPLADYPSISI